LHVAFYITSSRDNINFNVLVITHISVMMMKKVKKMMDLDLFNITTIDGDASEVGAQIRNNIKNNLGANQAF
jgi:hypothetical protein